jgi:hypothetical protein
MIAYILWVNYTDPPLFFVTPAQHVGVKVQNCACEAV